MTLKKMTSKRKKKLRTLAAVMNKQHMVSLPITQTLLECFDFVITPKEADFLLRMGNDLHSYEELALLSGMDKVKFKSFLLKTIKKGLIESFFDINGVEQFQLSAIAPGWFEHHLSDGRDDSEAREFSRRFNR